MKHLHLFFTSLACLFFVNGIAQKKFVEGSFSYNIQITGLKGEISSGLSGATLQVFLKPYLSRTEMVSSLGSETNVYDSKAGNGFLLRAYSAQKLMITMSKENWVQKNKMYKNLDFQVQEGITEISGYKCKKAIATLPNEKTFTVFYDPAIDVVNKEYSNAFNNLPGLLVQYEIQSGNLNFKYTLSNISWEPVSNSKFEAPKTGYRIMSYDENQQLKKGE
ncbi:MAG: hypothetical protein ABIY51_03850 [Ferruginibacter sp.]